MDVKDLRRKYKSLRLRDKQLALRQKAWKKIEDEKSFSRRMSMDQGEIHEVEVLRQSNNLFTILCDGQETGLGEFPSELTALQALGANGWIETK